MSQASLAGTPAHRPPEAAVRDEAPAGRRRLLTVSGAAVLLSSADTYVVVLALPAMMGDLGLGLNNLQQATPIITGFLLGYVALMLLIGRVSDVAGRRPLLYACLGLFAAGSLVTATAHDLGGAVAGRALQGAGGGGMVPVALALVADLWPVARRGVPLGAIGAAQEAGSVAGPLYGALVLTLSSWRTIFWLNLPLCAALAAALALSPWRTRQPEQRRRVDLLGLCLAAVALVAAGLAVAAPDALLSSAALGTLYSPLLGLGWLTPLSAVAIVAGVVFVARALLRGHESLAGCGRTEGAAADTWYTHVDWTGALLVAVVLAAIVLSFASADPAREPIAPLAAVALPLALAAAALFVLRERRARTPLVDLAALRPPGAYGALLTNLAVGIALMVALLDIPILARTTVFPDSQLGAALVLLRLLAAVPVGAALGGWLSQRFGVRPVAATGLLLAGGALALMARFTATTLADPFGPAWLHPSDPVLVAAGLGFGLAIAPVNASILSTVPSAMHGVASALVVVARVAGMLVGASVLTAVGLQQFYAEAGRLPYPSSLCPRTPLSCPAYDTLLKGAVVTELQVVFLGAAISAALAAACAAAFLGRPGRRTLATDG